MSVPSPSARTFTHPSNYPEMPGNIATDFRQLFGSGLGTCVSFVHKNNRLHIQSCKECGNIPAKAAQSAGFRPD
ncbi:MAG: hypothetical protein ACJAVM_002705 [Sulfitobacter sp.]|jgi:hypothetical protein